MRPKPPGARGDDTNDDLSGPLASVKLGRLRHVRRRDMVLRFAFGATVSIIAGIIGIVVGPRFGGLFLAFPAILPATLTLLEKREGTTDAVTDVRGALMGGVALACFAVVALVGMSTLGGIALVLALPAWLVVALGLYALDEVHRRRLVGRARAAGARPDVGLHHLVGEGWSVAASPAQVLWAVRDSGAGWVPGDDASHVGLSIRPGALGEASLCFEVVAVAGGTDLRLVSPHVSGALHWLPEPAVSASLRPVVARRVSALASAAQDGAAQRT